MEESAESPASSGIVMLLYSAKENRPGGIPESSNARQPPAEIPRNIAVYQGGVPPERKNAALLHRKHLPKSLLLPGNSQRPRIIV